MEVFAPPAGELSLFANGATRSFAQHKTQPVFANAGGGDAGGPKLPIDF